MIGDPLLDSNNVYIRQEKLVEPQTKQKHNQGGAREKIRIKQWSLVLLAINGLLSSLTTVYCEEKGMAESSLTVINNHGEMAPFSVGSISKAVSNALNSKRNPRTVALWGSTCQAVREVSRGESSKQWMPLRFRIHSFPKPTRKQGFQLIQTA